MQGSTGPAAPGADATPSPVLLTAARARVLQALRHAEEPLTTRELGRALDLHPTTVRFHLDRLVAEGLAVTTRKPSGRRGRPALRYQAIAGEEDREAMTAEVWSPMVEALAQALDESGKPGREQVLAAGRAWARRLGAGGPDALGTAFARLGFSPAPEPWGYRLLRCPFADSAGRHPHTICGIHLGLAQGLLSSEAGAEDIVLEPFAEPGACHLILGRSPKPAARPASLPRATPARSTTAKGHPDEH